MNNIQSIGGNDKQKMIDWLRKVADDIESDENPYYAGYMIMVDSNRYTTRSCGMSGTERIAALSSCIHTEHTIQNTVL